MVGVVGEEFPLFLLLLLLHRDVCSIPSCFCEDNCFLKSLRNNFSWFDHLGVLTNSHLLQENKAEPSRRNVSGGNHVLD